MACKVFNFFKKRTFVLPEKRSIKVTAMQFKQLWITLRFENLKSKIATNTKFSGFLLLK